MKWVLGTAFSLLLFVHGFAVAQGNRVETLTAKPEISADASPVHAGIKFDSAGINLSSAGALIVPVVPGGVATEGPAAGPNLPSTPLPNASMARPEEAVP